MLFPCYVSPRVLPKKAPSQPRLQIDARLMHVRIARQKYRPRDDTRRKNLHTLFQSLAIKLNPDITIRSDQCPMYKYAVQTYFPHAQYEQFKGRTSSVAGQGELKKGWRDPLFYINHTFAMCRANINRLVRKCGVQPSASIA